MRKFLARVFTTLIATVTLALSGAGCFVEEPNPPSAMFGELQYFSTLQNFTLIGGPSTTDLDYGEYYFTENGFRVNTPNRQVATQRDAYYVYDGTTNYTAYRQTETGEWYTQEINKAEYERVRKGVLELFFAFANPTTVADFTTVENGIVLNQEYTMTLQGYLHHFYNISFTLDAESKITSGAWKYYMSQIDNENARTAIYNFNLTAGGTTLTLPEIQPAPEAQA